MAHLNHLRMIKCLNTSHYEQPPPTHTHHHHQRPRPSIPSIRSLHYYRHAPPRPVPETHKCTYTGHTLISWCATRLGTQTKRPWPRGSMTFVANWELLGLYGRFLSDSAEGRGGAPRAREAWKDKLEIEHPYHSAKFHVRRSRVAFGTSHMV